MTAPGLHTIVERLIKNHSKHNSHAVLALPPPPPHIFNSPYFPPIHTVALVHVPNGTIIFTRPPSATLHLPPSPSPRSAEPHPSPARSFAPRPRRTRRAPAAHPWPRKLARCVLAAFFAFVRVIATVANLTLTVVCAPFVVQHRLRKEMRNISREPSPHITARPLPSNILRWYFVLEGPSDSPYEGGIFMGRLQFPEEYPFKPPGRLFSATFMASVLVSFRMQKES